MGVSVGVLDHFNIRTRKLADTVRFYEDILGLEKGARPNFAFPGHGCTARANRWCIWSIFPAPMSPKSPIPALSIMSPS
jgi:catechol 2,3-dioxygenase-like lactoylglutathione lyase family enzyme